MRRFRFSIASLLALVFFSAVAIAALRAADEAWETGIFGLTFLILLTAILLAVHRADRRRAFWLGFALFGWVYLGASLVPTVGDRLPMSKALVFVDSKIPGRDDAISFTVALSNPGNTTANTVYALASSPQGKNLVANTSGRIVLWNAVTGRLLAGSNGNTEDFVRIGHCLFALILAFLGGHLSRFLHGQGRRPVESQETGPSPQEATAPGR